MNNKRIIAYAISALIMIILFVVIGLFEAHKYGCSNVFEVYEKEMVLTKDVDFSDEVTMSHYGNPVRLSVGTTGMIYDVVNYFSDDYGKDYMRVTFILDDTSEFVTAVSVDPEAERKTEPLTQATIIDISNIETPNEVVEEYKLTRDKFEVRKTRLKYEGATIGLAISIIIVIIISVIICAFRKKNKSVTSIVVVVSIVEVVLLIYSIYDFVMINILSKL